MQQASSNRAVIWKVKNGYMLHPPEYKPSTDSISYTESLVFETFGALMMELEKQFEGDMKR